MFSRVAIQLHWPHQKRRSLLIHFRLSPVTLEKSSVAGGPFPFHDFLSQRLAKAETVWLAELLGIRLTDGWTEGLADGLID